jgi:hypothetical protein
MKTRFFSFLNMGTLFNTEHVKGVLNIMSKKLLSEAEFRKFAKLANLSTLAEKKIDEIYTADEEPVEEEVSFDDEETLEEEEELETEDMDMDVPMGDMGDEMPDDDMPEPAPMDDMDAGGEVMLSTEDAQSVAAALPAMEKIAAAVGEGDEELPDEPEAEMDLDAELGGGEEEEVPMQEEESDEVELNEEDLIEVVAQRVAQRLQKEKSMEDVVSQLAERILKKLEN